MNGSEIKLKLKDKMASRYLDVIIFVLVNFDAYLFVLKHLLPKYLSSLI